MCEKGYYHSGEGCFRDLRKMRVFSFSEHSLSQCKVPNKCVNKIIITCSFLKKENIFIIIITHYYTQLSITIIHFIDELS